MSTELLHKPSRTTALLSSYVGKTKSCSHLKYVLEQRLRTKLSRHPQSHLLPITFPVGTCRRRAGPAPAPVGAVPVVAPSSPGRSGRSPAPSTAGCGMQHIPSCGRSGSLLQRQRFYPIPPVIRLFSLLFYVRLICMILTALGPRLFQQLLVCKSH